MAQRLREAFQRIASQANSAVGGSGGGGGRGGGGGGGRAAAAAFSRRCINSHGFTKTTFRLSRGEFS
ncbi:MAG: hypothetical protein F6K62_05975 [Sphaerospermopsis sp. SIO1G2]|nr:hypothetical protein [Sphaerospermopsis sp. SIO1G2]